MTKTMSNDERIAYLAALGIKPDAETLGGSRAIDVQMTTTAAPVAPVTSADVVLAPPGIDPKMQPVDEIVFDPRLLDKFTSLDGDALAAASAHVFSFYKSYGRNKERNGALHRKITTFITQTRRERQAPGMVSAQIKTTKDQRDMAALLASQGLTTEDLVALIQAVK